MHIFKTIKPLKGFIDEAKSSNSKIGLVPTMGALHEGHMAIIRKSLKDNDITVCSIYVNPLQFNNSDDLDKYPRNLKRDLDLLEEAGCQAVFSPPDEVMYPEGKKNSMELDFGNISQILEGKHRPGHFSGVGVVLSKIFHLIAPDQAYFGQKDLQQVAVVRKLIQDLFFDIQLTRVPTIRNNKGLALSSRNSRLSGQDKLIASQLYLALTVVKEELLQRQVSVTEARQKALQLLEETASIKLEYLEIVDAGNFGMVSDIQNHREVAVCIAAYVGGVRLIDNILL